MNAEQRVRMIIGEYVVHIASMQVMIEERDAKIKELEAKLPPEPKPAE